ncbi:putative baseplate assembly protein [Terriglobus albidus]|uniref:Putative baseplate assembly protein n=1 Tax=Terriglobus albidus TaxID=1592106 RepID=A0A5B9EFW7_9BACT|nr:putative baseplate assembly protein [Terriglobus albidus]QEE29660.1 putative baseplate assembly protein [Terriglobus albidus]
MMPAAPAVDPRSRADLIAEAHRRLAQDIPGWTADPSRRDAAAGLVQVFGRFAELVVERINRVSDQHRELFLEQLGVTVMPPQPARVPLTFSPVPGATIAAVVPAGVQVASAPSPGESKPVIFETDREVVVSTAQLDRLMVQVPETDRYTDLSSLLSDPAEQPVPIFTGNSPMEHAFWVGDTAFFGKQALRQLVLSFDLEEVFSATQPVVAWEIWNGSEALTLTPTSDGTNAMTQSGDVVFQDMPAFPETTVEGETAYWLRCRLLSPLAAAVHARSLTLERTLSGDGVRLVQASSGSRTLELDKDFFPFGDRPRFGDTLYLAQPELFGVAATQVKLQVHVTNPAVGEGDVPVPRVNAAGNARVAWEFWDGAVWQLLGMMTTSAATPDSGNGFSDSTRAFTASGEVTFVVPAELRASTVGGVTALWLRARLAANSYGEDAGYAVRESKPGVPEYVYQPATVSAPILHSVLGSYSLHQAASRSATVLVTHAWQTENVSESLRTPGSGVLLFRRSAEVEPALYCGFQSLPGLGLPTLPMTLYFVFDSSRQRAGQLAEGTSQRIAWQCWNGSAWQDFGVVDETAAFSYSGAVTLLAPAAAQASTLFGLRRHWLRVPWRAGGADLTAALRMVLLNTVSATQAVTSTHEILGSGNALPGQRVKTARSPVLPGERLEVRELSHSVSSGRAEHWVPYERVPDLRSSGPEDRHYTLDRITGEIVFGDGVHGRLTPSGSNNLRMAIYRTGGGTAGNRGRQRIVQMKTTIPYVRSVTNMVEASGGADAESPGGLLDRAPRQFRHRCRAVTVEDYADLALLASPAVARAHCVPGVDLAADAGARQGAPGVVSILIVPGSVDPRPHPDADLLHTVQTYLMERQSPTVSLVVVGPDYLAIDVAIEVAITRLDRIVETEFLLRSRVAAFSHPLTGGFDGQGWEFGRQPYRSDILALVSTAPDVDHVRTLDITPRELRAGAAQTSHFIICPGDITVTFTLIPA